MKQFLPKLLICLLFVSAEILAHDAGKNNGFVPNMGQWDSRVLYRMPIPNGAMFLEKDGFSYTFYDGTHLSTLHDHQTPEHPIPEKIKTHTLRLKLEGASQQVMPQPDEPSLTKYNYFIGNDSRRWASGLSAYGSVTYPEVYPGTTMKLYVHENQVKYDFILKPGADITQIRMNYQGAERIFIRDGKLILKTSLGEVTEQAPVAWQSNGVQKFPVECKFQLLEDGTVGFQAESLDPQLELVIDPQVVFATYSGSVDDNWGFTSTNDNAGNGYAAGIVFGVNFQTTPGAAQENFGGGQVDIGIIKFNATGTQALYVTYLGGNNLEFPHSIIVNEYNELIMFGTTGSSDFPTTSGAYSSTFSGGTATSFAGLTLSAGSDIFICRLSVNGENLLGSTLLGGSRNDGLNNAPGINLSRNYADEIRGALWVDANNNIYVGTSTLSQDFPGTSGSFQPNYGGGGQDGIIIKMNGNLSKLLWASYLGGSSNDGIFYLTVDKTEAVIVTGGTQSSNFPVSGGAWQAAFGGGPEPDGFVTKIDSSGKQLLASTYVGSPDYDQSYIVGTDITNHIYLFGQTSASGLEFVVNSPIGIAGGNQFIIKLEPDLKKVVWSTTFGKAQGRPDISPTALLVDVCDKIYVSGWGGSLNKSFNAPMNGLITTPGAVKTVTDGNDFYLYVINNQATAVDYASFYGGDLSRDHVDGGTSRFDRKGVIYQAICAGCGGGFDDLPVTPGAYSATNNSINCNNALFKFDFESPIVISSFVLADTSGVNLSVPVGCAPFIVQFKNTSINATAFKWKVNGAEVSTTKDLTRVFNTSGKYEITLIASSSSSCNISDTSSMTITILDAIEGKLTDLNACKGQQVTLGPDGFDDPYYTFTWTPSQGLDNPAGRKPKITATAETTYKLVISIGSCTDTLLQKVKISGSKSELPARNICQADTVLIGPEGQPPSNATFSWTPSGSLSNPTVFKPKAFPSASTTYTMLLTKAGEVCADTLTQRVNVGKGTKTVLPQANVCFGDSVQLGPQQPLQDVISQNWIPVTGISNSTLQNPKAFGETSRQYLLILKKSSCNDTLEQKMEVIGQPLEAFPLITACKGDSVSIGFKNPLPGSGIGYAWSPPQLVNNPGKYNPKVLATGDLQFTLIISWPINGCKDTLTSNVKGIIEQFDAGPDVNACKGKPVLIGVPDLSSQYTYQWSPAGPAVSPDKAATQVTVENPTLFKLLRIPAGSTIGCRAVDSLFVNLSENPVAAFGYVVEPECNNLAIQLIDSSQSADQLNWFFANGLSSTEVNPVVRLSYGDTLGVLQVAISGACRDSLSINEKMKMLSDYYKEQDVNVFSPNGDGINECFSPALQPGMTASAPPDTTFLECSSLSVFNRWGELIFDSMNDKVQACWNGKTKDGAELPEGVYFYRYVFKETNRSGFVTLRRNGE
jgi:gliding motility-associated-like protein